MLFVIKSSLYQLQLKDAWTQRDIAMEALRNENAGLRAALADRQWLGEVERRVRAAPKVEGVLFAEISAKLVQSDVYHLFLPLI